MPEVTMITAEVRHRAGKGAARATRRAGRVPAVIYGGKQGAILISLDPRVLTREINHPGFYTRLFDVEVGGTKHRTLARDVQFDAVTDQPLHVDFFRLGADTTIRVEVPVAFINEEDSPGINRGGVLNVVRYEVELICTADNLPQQLVVDLTGLDIGDSVHISAVELPEGATPTIRDRDFTVATIAAPTILRVEEEEVAAEGEEVEGEEDEAEAVGEGEEPTQD